jgi:hypothetical protein
VKKEKSSLYSDGIGVSSTPQIVDSTLKASSISSSKLQFLVFCVTSLTGFACLNLPDLSQ